MDILDSSVSAKDSGLGPNFWYRWIPATAAGYLAALVIGIPLIRFGFAGQCITAVLGGVLLATPQWWILRTYLLGLRWFPWAAMTALSQIAVILESLVINVLVPDNFYDIVYNSDNQFLFLVVLGMISGSLIGGCQWLVLRRHVEHAGWWVLANIAAWACAQVVSPWVASWSSSTIAGVLIGVITAIALTRILPKQSRVPATANEMLL